MEKYSLFGELLYLGFVCEKGRCQRLNFLNFKYRKVLKKHISLLQMILKCILKPELTKEDSKTLSLFIKSIKNDKELSRYYPFNNENILFIVEEKYEIIDSIDRNKNNENVNILMDLLITEIIELLCKNIFVNNNKIIMLIRAAHNLPRVYLGRNLNTLCELNLPQIDPSDAIDFAFLNMDEKTKDKYKKIINNNLYNI